MTGTADVSIALLGTVGALAFSLLTSNAIKYFVGIGFFGIAFLLTYVIFYDLNISMFSGLVSAVIIGIFFEWLKGVDSFSTTLLVGIAAIGVLLLVTILLNLRFQDLNIPTYAVRKMIKPNIGYVKQLEQAIKLLK